VVGLADQAGKNAMNELMKLPCSECGGRLKRKSISQEFEKEGVKVKLKMAHNSGGNAPPR
jgi:hypothetical protein